MARPITKEETWHQKLSELMVRQSLSIRAAATALNAPLTPEQAEELFHSRYFQKLLWSERHKFWAELAHDPARTKASAIGAMVLAISKLIDEAEWEKVLEGILKLAKVEGWIGGDSTVNVFANLTAKELEEVKMKLKENFPQFPKGATNA